MGRRLGIALPLSALLIAAVMVIQASPAAATQLENQITTPDTDVVSAGLGGMRGGTGTGSITLSGVSGAVTQALLYWHGPTNSPVTGSNAEVTFDGVPVTGTSLGFSHDNCWGFFNSEAYRADVSDLVTEDGTYALADFRKTVEDTVIADINGVSLIVFFDDGDASNDHDVTLIEGNDSNFANSFDPDGWNATLEDVSYSGGSATLQLHVGDGQSFDDPAVDLNGDPMAAAGAIFQGDSVPSAGGPDPLWDIKDFDITSFMSAGTNDLQLTSGSPSDGQDCLSLVVAMANVDVAPSADLSIDKTDGNSDGEPTPCPGDPPIPCGPDPVSSGQPVAYGISVTNNGPDSATGVTVTDTPQTGGATAQSGFGTNWVCTVDSESNTVSCTYGPTLDSGATAEPLTVVVQAPTTSTGTTMTDQASVTADQEDANTENNTDSEDTTVTGSGEAGTEDHATGFFDNINTLTIATERDETGRFYSSLTIFPDEGLEPGVVTIDEFPATMPPYQTLCGDRPCDAQVQVTVLPAGQAAADNAMEVHWFYVRDKKQGSKMWVKGDLEEFGTVVPNCITRGIADPPKCVNSKRILRNGDREIVLLWRDLGDPWGGKR